MEGSFWEGFLKQASSLVGDMPGITSGLRAYSKRGRLRTAMPVSGQTIGARSVPTPVPGPKLIPASVASSGANVASPAPKSLPKPKFQTSRGLGSTAL